jgi:hypothetical protein
MANRMSTCDQLHLRRAEPHRHCRRGIPRICNSFSKEEEHTRSDRLALKVYDLVHSVEWINLFDPVLTALWDGDFFLELDGLCGKVEAIYEGIIKRQN